MIDELRREGGRLAASLILVGGVTWIGGWVLRVNATTAGFAYLIVILGIAATWGRIQSIAASFGSVLCLNFFFLPPVGRFTIADPQNWVALFSFLATSLVASHLSERARQQAERALARQKETEQLYALSRAILLSDKRASIGAQVAQQVAQIFGCRAAGLLDARSGELFPGGAADVTELASRLRQVATQEEAMRVPELEATVAPIALGGQPIGSLVIVGRTLTDGAMQALLNLVAIALERVRTEEISNRAEAARQSEEFKSTLLDAIAHEFKTPLTSIKAAATSLQSDFDEAPAAVKELASIIDEETDRLNQLVTEGVRMSQIDAAKVKIQRRPVAIAELWEEILGLFATRLEGRPVTVEAAADIEALADRTLLSMALRQLVDNGLKYAPAGAGLTIQVWSAAGAVEMSVGDGGPGIPEADRERIFEKFFRLRGTSGKIPGSGMGLYIAREILRAHGGEMWVEAGDEGGTVFRLRLPAGEETAGR